MYNATRVNIEETVTFSSINGYQLPVLLRNEYMTKPLWLRSLLERIEVLLDKPTH